jgi:hypothetical protein
MLLHRLKSAVLIGKYVPSGKNACVEVQSLPQQVYLTFDLSPTNIRDTSVCNVILVFAWFISVQISKVRRRKLIPEQQHPRSKRIKRFNRLIS